MTNSNANLYDFSDLSDLPENLQNKLASTGGAEPALVGEIVDIVVNAPRALSLAQIIAVATRKGLELPAETTVRAYVNRAVEDDRISKPTRQTYAGPVAATEEAPATTENTASTETDNDDPLADL